MPRKKRPSTPDLPPDTTPGIQPRAGKKPGQRSRCTKAEKEVRMIKLMRLSLLGYTVDALEEYAMENFGVLREMARLYVHEMLDIAVASVSVYDKKRIAAITLMRFEQAFRLAASQRNPAAMVAANAQIAQHWVHAAPSITPPADQTPPEDDPEEDF